MAEAQDPILLVDDDDDGRRMLARRLTRRGYEVHEAHDGPSALSRVDERGYCLVLLDVRMPGMNGVEVARRIRASFDSLELPIIMVSAEGQGSLITAALEAGADDYVTKPVDLPVLLARIKSQLRLRELVAGKRGRPAPPIPPPPDARPAPDRRVVASAPTAPIDNTPGAVRDFARRGPPTPGPASAPRPQARVASGSHAPVARPPSGRSATVSGNRRPPRPPPGVTVDGTLGRVIAGKYRIEREIGKGGFGAVYRGVHVDLETHVAIKVLDQNLATTDEALERFRREGVATCRVQHPNAVAMYDFGVEPDGLAFLVMELLTGEDLAIRMRRQRQMPVADMVEIAAPICDVLAVAHEQGVVHRDMKPANIFLHRRSETDPLVVKVMDFGVARLLDSTGRAALTASGSAVGTPAFISPEAARGNPCTGASDIYSLGVMAWYMLMGRHPFSKPGVSLTPFEFALAHIQQEPPPLQESAIEVDPGVAEVIMASLAKDPRDRPLPATMARALRAATR